MIRNGILRKVGLLVLDFSEKKITFLTNTLFVVMKLTRGCCNIVKVIRLAANQIHQ